jgi:hypothetical protein
VPQVWHEVDEAETSGRAVVLRHGHVMRRVMLALFPAAFWLAWFGHGILAAHGGV